MSAVPSQSGLALYTAQRFPTNITSKALKWSALPWTTSQSSHRFSRSIQSYITNLPTPKLTKTNPHQLDPNLHGPDLPRPSTTDSWPAMTGEPLGFTR